MKMFPLVVILAVLSLSVKQSVETITLSKSETFDYSLQTLTLTADDIVAKLNSGSVTVNDLVPSWSHDQPQHCDHGPQQVLHTVPNEFYWPPISRGLCYDLSCDDNSPCIIRRMDWKSRWVFVIKKNHSLWTNTGYELKWYLDHLNCGCSPNKVQCIPPRVMVHGRCKCPKMKCSKPRGQVINSTSCECDCPPGSEMNDDNICVRVCEGLERKHRCKKGPPHKQKCKCPTCEEQRESSKCARTYCGHHYNTQCKWDKKCSCPGSVKPDKK